MCLSSIAGAVEYKAYQRLPLIAGAVEYKAYQRLPLVSQFVNIFSLDIKTEVEYTRCSIYKVSNL